MSQYPTHRPPASRRHRLWAALPLLCVLTSCQYVKDRSLDFLDQYRISVGAGSVVGVRSSNLGLVDTGLMFGIKPNAARLGWRYGSPLFFNENDTTMDADQAEIIKTTHIVDMDYGKGSYHSARESFALLPALFTWTDSTPTDFEWQVPEEGDDFADNNWLWSPAAISENRYAQIHAFDVEFEVGLLVYLDFGFSPGELIDFLVGFTTIDLAADDGRF